MPYVEAVVERAMKLQEVMLRAVAGTLTWLQAAREQTDLLSTGRLCRGSLSWRATGRGNSRVRCEDPRAWPGRRTWARGYR